MSGSTDRAGELVKILISSLLDLVFLATVVVLNWCAHEYVFSLFELSGPAEFARLALEWVFVIATVGPAVLYVAGDLISSTKKMIARSRPSQVIDVRSQSKDLPDAMDPAPSSLPEPTGVETDDESRR